MSNLPEKPEEKETFLEALENMRPDLMYPELMTKGSDKVSGAFSPSAIKAGMLSSIPMMCAGNDCIIADQCPLVAEGIAPVGKPCPIEASIVRQFFLDYAEELQVDTTRMAEVSLLRDLVDQEVQQIRKSWVLSREHFIQENVVGLSEDGEVIMKKELHQAVDYEDRLLKRKKDLRNALLATREAKLKTGEGKRDSAQEMATLLTQMRQMDIEREKAMRVEAGLDYRDDYIEAEIVKEETNEF